MEDSYKSEVRAGGGGGDDEVKTASFRSEEYNSTRRAFLRSYPLQWGDGEEEEEFELGSGGEEEGVCPGSKKKKSKRNGSKGCVSVGSRVMAVLHLGDGKFLLLRKLKSKVAFYLVSCNPFMFSKHSNHLLTRA